MSVLAPANQWVVPSRDPAAEQRLRDDLGIGPLLAAVLARRGLTDAHEAATFLHPALSELPDPSLLPDYRPAVDALIRARESGHLIFLHGDYDVDGVTSVALFARFLRKIGCNVHPHVPHRMKEGYGIHAAIVEEAAELGAKLFLTCDCGASAFEQVESARARGMEVVVTDHHHVQERWPEAHAFVNPHRKDSQYPFSDLCGVGVVFKLCQGLAQELEYPVESFQKAYLDLVALGTVADVMPLVGENRTLVRHGLPQLSQTKKPGLQALIRCAQLDGKTAKGLDSSDIGYKLGPRLNAAGRIDDAARSMRLLLADSLEEAMPIAQELEALNLSRREQQDRILEEALAMVHETGQEEAPIIIVGGVGWHPGIVGIVAGKIRERFHRPAFVLAFDSERNEYRGSGRSIPAFHLAEAIEAHSGLVDGGGHAKAAGMTICGDRYEEAVSTLQAYAGSILSPEHFVPTVEAAAEIELGEASMGNVAELATLEPFGEGNRQPIFCARSVEIKQVKATRNPEHPQVVLSQNGQAPVQFAAFRMGERLAGFKCPRRADILFDLAIDEWNGTTKVSYRLQDYVCLD